MLLGYFPEPYEGELVYSLIARYGRHSGIKGSQAINSRIFGTSRQPPSYNIPIRLSALAACLPEKQGLTAQTLVAHHTLFPYYAAFLSIEDRKKTLNGIIEGQKYSKQLLTGTAGRSLRFLRCCLACCEEMKRENGEMYWRREHQIPAMLICFKHNCRLQLTKVVSGGRATTYVAATSATCTIGCSPIVSELTTAQLEDLNKLADDTMRVLMTGYTPPNNTEKWKKDSRSICVRKGLSLGADSISRSKLSEAVMDRFGYLERAWPEMLGLQDGGLWLSVFKNKNRSRKNINPVRAFICLETLNILEDDYGPFGRGPWKCRNPLADHFHKPVIVSTQRKFVIGGQTIVFACKCGWTYTAERRATRDQKSGTGNCIDFGLELRNHILTALNEFLSASSAARRLGVSRSLL